MNLFYAKLVEVLSEDGMRMGKIRVGGALKKVSLELLTDAGRGDSILVCDGIALGKVENRGQTEINYVSGHPR